MLIDLLTKQRQLSRVRFGDQGVGIEIIHSVLTQQLDALSKNYESHANWAKCLMLCFAAAMKLNATPDSIVSKLDIYNIRWYALSLTDIKREVFLIAILEHRVSWHRWMELAANIFVVAISYHVSVDDLLRAIAKELERRQEPFQAMHKKL